MESKKTKDVAAKVANIDGKPIHSIVKIPNRTTNEAFQNNVGLHEMSKDVQKEPIKITDELLAKTTLVSDGAEVGNKKSEFRKPEEHEGNPNLAQSYASIVDTREQKKKVNFRLTHSVQVVDGADVVIPINYVKQ